MMMLSKIKILTLFIIVASFLWPIHSAQAAKCLRCYSLCTPATDPNCPPVYVWDFDPESNNYVCEGESKLTSVCGELPRDYDKEVCCCSVIDDYTSCSKSTVFKCDKNNWTIDDTGQFCQSEDPRSRCCCAVTSQNISATQIKYDTKCSSKPVPRGVSMGEYDGTGICAATEKSYPSDGQSCTTYNESKIVNITPETPPEYCDLKASNTGIIPNSILDNPEYKCNRNINIFLLTAIYFAKYLFSIVGALALVVFIYGGFLLVLSEGSPDKIKKGTDAITTAVIGLFIVFGAYILVAYLSEAVGLAVNNFKL